MCKLGKLPFTFWKVIKFIAFKGSQKYDISRRAILVDVVSWALLLPCKSANLYRTHVKLESYEFQCIPLPLESCKKVVKCSTVTFEWLLLILLMSLCLFIRCNMHQPWPFQLLLSCNLVRNHKLLKTGMINLTPQKAMSSTSLWKVVKCMAVNL